MTLARLPTYFISHGGGPWPYMDGPFRAMFATLEASIRDVPRQIGGLPRAILVVTGHWEEPVFTVSSGAAPGMVYDYSGFPEHTYHVRYPAPGSPELASRVETLLDANGIAHAADPARGYDHGTFSILEPLRPQADIPIVQLSILEGYDPAAHWRAGRALAPLRDEGVLIVGSGLSYHNMRGMNAAGVEPSARFDAWLQETLLAADPAEREARLADWASAPAARLAHPREDHLVPLLVAAGAAADERAACVYHEDRLFGGITASSFRFGAAVAANAEAA